MIKEVDFLSSVGEACGAPPLFAFINSVNVTNNIRRIWLIYPHQKS